IRPARLERFGADRRLARCDPWVRCGSRPDRRGRGPAGRRGHVPPNRSGAAAPTDTVTAGTTYTMITCRELIDFLDDYVANDMEPSRRRTVDEHLAVCPECVRYVD